MGRLLTLAGKGFEPRDLGNLVLWLDAFALGTLTLSGSNLTAWRDKSTAGNNGTATNNPTYSATGFGSAKPGITFPADSSVVTISDSTTLGLTTMSIFMAYQRDTDTGGTQTILRKGTTAGTNAEYQLNCSSGDAFNVNGSANGTTFGTSFNVTGALTVGAGFILEAHYDGTNLIGRSSNGNTNQSALASIHNGTAALQIGLTGSRMTLGELLIFNTYLPTGKQARARGYLARKWGVTLS